MRTPIRYMLRLSIVVAVLVSVSVLAAPFKDAGSPYLSALSTLTAPNALAGECPFMKCRLINGTIQCANSPIAASCTMNGTSCQSSPC